MQCWFTKVANKQVTTSNIVMINKVMTTQDLNATINQQHNPGTTSAYATTSINRLLWCVECQQQGNNFCDYTAVLLYKGHTPSFNIANVWNLT